MPSTPEFVAVILAGGASARMGSDKAFLLWEGRPLLRRQIDTARAAGAKQVWISGRKGVDYHAFGCLVIVDSVKDAGPLGGMAAVLQAARGKFSWLLALAVDLPCMTPDYLQALAVSAAVANLGMLPQRGPYYEPLAAVYPVEPALAAVKDQIEGRHFAMQELAAGLVEKRQARAVPIRHEERTLFANWNDAGGPRPAVPE